MTPLLDVQRDLRAAATTFDLPTELSATTPPEARGLARDGVRLLVATGSGITHSRFTELPTFLRAGDLVVINNSATLPAAVDGRRESGPVTVHFSTALDDGTWLVELRPGRQADGPVRDALAGEYVWLPDGDLTLLAGYPDGGHRSGRLWRARVDVPGTVQEFIAAHGRPITYAYLTGKPLLDAFQTVFALEPGSAEMPSAARPFSRPPRHRARHTRRLRRANHAAPGRVLYGGRRVPVAGAVPRAFSDCAAGQHDPGRGWARDRGRYDGDARSGVGLALPDGSVEPAAGWTDLVLTPERPARVIDGLVTGWHAPGASHLLLLESVAGADLVQRAYAEAVRGRYLWHEFGDSALLLPTDSAR